MKTKNLYNLLNELEDRRRKQWRMHSLPVILLITIMWIMNWANSERWISRFAENNKDDLIKQIKKTL